jgi:pimeloyl-ACP methyl ester carboxylesterase
MNTTNRTRMLTHYRSIAIDGIDVFYRESGPADAPVLLLLHGCWAGSASTPLRRT